MTQYAVYTMRRTSSRTVYAIYDTFASQPVCKDGTQTPVTFTDRHAAHEYMYALLKGAKP